MDFTISSEMQLLIETVRRFVEEEVQPYEAEVEELGAVPPKLAAVKEKAKSLGLYAMGMPEEVGGGGLNTLETCLVEEQLGRTTTALIRYVFGQVYPMLLACKGLQREKYLLPTVRGDKICAMAITEPGAGSDAASIATTAVWGGEAYAINGRKHFISDGDAADYIVLMALTDPDKRARGGITLFLVDKETPGFEVGRIQGMMGHRSSTHAELIFENCRVGPENVLGELGGGFQLVLQSGVSRVRLTNVGARSVGMASRVLDMARRYANERVQFGRPIADYQLIQGMIADMATEIFATRMMVLNTAWEVDQGRDVREKISMVKLYASEMMNRVVDRALQIFGGMGYTTDLPIERIYRDSRVLRIWDGTSEIHRLQIAKKVLRDGLQL